MRETWDGVTVEWGSAEIERGVRIHYGVAGTGDRTVMPDYRGAGGSSKPSDG